MLLGSKGLNAQEGDGLNLFQIAPHILAVLNLLVAMMSHIKFQLNLTYG